MCKAYAQKGYCSHFVMHSGVVDLNDAVFECFSLRVLSSFNASYNSNTNNAILRLYQSFTIIQC